MAVSQHRLEGLVESVPGFRADQVPVVALSNQLVPGITQPLKFLAVDLLYDALFIQGVVATGGVLVEVGQFTGVGSRVLRQVLRLFFQRALVVVAQHPEHTEPDG